MRTRLSTPLHKKCNPNTSAVRAFGPGYFRDSASVLELRHIGARPKGTSFWPRLSPEAIASVFCLGSERTEAIASVSSSQWWLWLLLLFWLILAHRCSGDDDALL